MLLMTLSTLALTISQRRALAERNEGQVCQLRDCCDNQAYLPSFEPIQNWKIDPQADYGNSKNNLGSRLIKIRGKYSNKITVPA